MRGGIAMENRITEATGMFNKCIQIGIVVKDIEKTCAYLRETFGWEPVGYADTPPGEKYYHGKQEDFSVRMAFYRLPNLEIELLMPLRGENVWKDWLTARGEGLHHILFDVSSFAKAQEQLESNGIKLVQQGPSARYEGAKWGYFDATEKLGYYIEIFNPSEFGYKTD